MSSLATPLLILNLGGEMSYILEQRLQAQNAIEDKGTVVLHQIISTLLRKVFVNRMFLPQPIGTRLSMRHIFEKIVHSSLMRLNDASMDKLFDLMIMAVKYQVIAIRHPYELLNLTLNHLDGIRNVTKNDPKVAAAVAYAYKMVRKVYFQLPEWKIALIRTTMLSFFQDAKIKVSMLLRENKQTREGDIITDALVASVPPQASVPGYIRYYQNGEFLNSTSFTLPTPFTGSSLSSADYDRRLELQATDRGTSLGTNLYASTSDSLQVKGGSSVKDKTTTGDELRLLTSLLGAVVEELSGALPPFELFDDDETAKSSKVAPSRETAIGKVKINKTPGSLNRALEELEVRPSTKKGRAENLASLMDEVSKTGNTSSPKRSSSVKRKPSGGAADEVKKPPSRSASAKRNSAAK